MAAPVPAFRRPLWASRPSARKSVGGLCRLATSAVLSAKPFERGLAAEATVRYTAEHVAVIFPQVGGCLCGATRYEIREDPLIAYACHCTDCQTASGSGFALCLTTPIASIDVVSGSLARRTISFEDGREWNFRVCGNCETRLWSERNGMPEIANIRAGTLDDTTWVYPVAHIWVESALDWSPIAADAILFPGQPGDPTEMIRAWRERTSS